MSEFLPVALLAASFVGFAWLHGFRCGWRSENDRIESTVRFSADLRRRSPGQEPIVTTLDELADRIARRKP